MKKIAVFALLGLLLVGCSSSKEKTTVCKGDLSTGQSSEYTIESKGDKMTLLKSQNKMDTSDLGATEEQINAIMEQASKMYDGVKGVKYESKLENSMLIETIEINYKEADLDELEDLGLLQFEDSGKIKYVSLDETVKSLEKDSYTCTEK